MIFKSSRVRLRNVAVVAVLALGPILSACSSPTIEVVAKITSPAANSTVKVGEQLQIEGQVTGDGITQVDVVIDGNPYAQLTVQDKDKSVGVSNFPIAAGQVPWTPASPGPHALQLIVYKAPDNQLLKKSEPVLITAVPAGEQAQPTPDGGAGATAAPPTPPPAPPTAAPSNNGGGAQPPAPAATAAPGGNAGNAGAPSLTVINDFVNVRKGPGVGYDRLGQLDKGQSAPVKGKSADGEWLQISYPSAANGVGWVKLRDGSDSLVQPNTAANSVAVASAPPLPTSEPAPAAPAAPAVPASGVTIVPLGPAATSPPAVLPTAIPQQGSLVGAGGILRINANPVGSGGTVIASWSIPNFRDGEFDMADGRGFVPPIAGVMNVTIGNVTSSRTITVRWRETNGTQKQDSITINVSGSAPAATASSDCNSSNSQWQGTNSNYPFCVASGFYWEQGVKEVAYFAVGQDYTLTGRWNIYGINGVRLIVEGNQQQCGPAGPTRIDQAATGTGGNSFNIKDLAYGGYIVHLYITRRDNVPVFYNEKFLCVGTGQPNTAYTSTPGPTATSQPTAQPTALPLAPTSTTAPAAATPVQLEATATPA